MKTFREFITEAPTEAQAAQMAPGMSPEKRRRALERNARNQARRDTPATPQDRMRRAPQKALPPGGGALAKRQSSAMTQTDKSGTLATRDKGGSLTSRDKPGATTPNNDGDWGKPIPDWEGDSKQEKKKKKPGLFNRARAAGRMVGSFAKKHSPKEGSAPSASGSVSSGASTTVRRG